MTTIRKIVTSKIEGDDANSTSTSEVRPFGEMAVYINADTGGPDKLELLMFDGARTHLRSKVLAKGTFYGGDADSGDQGDGIENLDTIKLIPDAELHYNDGDYGNDQYIVIDPTLPNHIHVRAGGAIDASSADLFLGGEENNVMVSDADDQVEIRTNDTHTWLFGTDGNLTLPIGSDIVDSNNKSVIRIESPFSIKSADFSAIAGGRYGVNTTSVAVTATLPASPATGIAIYFADAGGAFASNNLIIARNGQTIMGSASDMTVNTNDQSFGLFYNGTTWRVY